MLTITMREANQNFSRYALQVERGEEIMVTKRGLPVLRLMPVPTAQPSASEREVLIQKALSFRMARPCGKLERGDAHQG